eukprot:SAG11_NODE_1747_length_4330_cov_2.029307_3_plen_392_part_00
MERATVGGQAGGQHFNLGWTSEPHRHFSVQTSPAGSDVLELRPPQSGHNRCSWYGHANAYLRLKLSQDAKTGDQLASSVQRVQRFSELVGSDHHAVLDDDDGVLNLAAQPSAGLEQVVVVVSDTGNADYPIFRRGEFPDYGASHHTVLFDAVAGATHVYTNANGKPRAHEPALKFAIGAVSSGAKRTTAKAHRISMNVLSYHYIAIDAAPPPASVLEEAIAYAAKSLKLQGVDLEDRLFASTEPAYLRSLSAFASAHQVELLSLGVKVDFSIVPTKQTMLVEVCQAKRWVDVAAALSIPLLRLPGNGAPPTAAGREATLQLVAAKMKQMVAYGASKGVSIGLHNHNHGAVPSTGDQVFFSIEILLPFSDTKSIRCFIARCCTSSTVFPASC